MTTGLQLHTFDQLRLTPQAIHDARKLTCIATCFTEFLLEAIDLLNHCHGDNQIVVFKAEKSLRIVQDNVCIKYEGFAHKRDQSFSRGVTQSISGAVQANTFSPGLQRFLANDHIR